MQGAHPSAGLPTACRVAPACSARASSRADRSSPACMWPVNAAAAPQTQMRMTSAPKPCAGARFENCWANGGALVPAAAGRLRRPVHQPPEAPGWGEWGMLPAWLSSVQGRTSLAGLVRAKDVSRPAAPPRRGRAAPGDPCAQAHRLRLLLTGLSRGRGAVPAARRRTGCSGRRAGASDGAAPGAACAAAATRCSCARTSCRSPRAASRPVASPAGATRARSATSPRLPAIPLFASRVRASRHGLRADARSACQAAAPGRGGCQAHALLIA